MIERSSHKFTWLELAPLLALLTIDPRTRTIKASRRIREEFENGRDYYRLDDQPIREPENKIAFPSIEKLKYHYESEFRS